MKTKLLTILLFLFPVMLFAQNYEKEGDMYFEEGKYLEAEKKYKAAATLSGESSVLNQKQEKSSTCYTLLIKAKEAEEKEMYSTAVDSYNELYSIHNLPQYKEKANALKQKVEQLQKEKEKNNINELYQKGLEYYEQNNLSWAYDEFEVAAEKGHVNSMYYCGKCCEKYSYYRDALEWYQHAADHGHVDAQYKLGEFYYKGKGVNKDESLGLEWYTKAAENNQKNAILFLVEGFHDNSLSGNEAKWYKKAAEIGIYLGEYHLAIYYEQGTGGVANDVNKALKWYNRAKKSSEQLYWDNNDKWPNNIVQEVWMKSKEKVKELKSLLDKQKKKEDAMKKADDYFNKKQFSSAIESYKEALVLDNDKDILYKLGCCYEQMSQHKSAVVTYLEAANQNHKDAAYQLGLCYEHGKGVDINHDKAITWYLKAEKQGHKEAQIAAKKLKEKVLLIKNIADYKSKGESCFNSYNYNESVKWYEKAAENGNVKAQNKIGNYYNYGIGVDKNTTTAYKWYKQAADNGHSTAKVRITQDDYFSLWNNWEVTWLGVNGSLGTGYELGISVLRVRYLWFELNLLDFKLSDRFSNIKEFGYSEPYLFYQPTLNVLFPVYDRGAVYLGMGPSWEIYMQEFDPQLKVEAGFRFNYGYNASSDVFLRYDGYTFSVGASIQWHSFFY